MNNNRFSRSLVACFAALLALTLLTTAATAAPATQLTISYTDPVGDNTGAIDVTKMDVVFDSATGNFTITLTATPTNPFVGEFRVNINLFNPDTASTNSFFQDDVLDFNLATATTTLTLTGINTNLMSWKIGDRVATNNEAGLGSPPGVTLFRTSVWSPPYTTFLTNEDAIAYGPAGVATIHGPGPKDELAVLSGDIEALLQAGTLTQDQAAGLLDKLEAATASLDRGATTPACNQVGAFINQVNAFINASILTPQEGQALIAVAEDIQGQIGCR